MNGKLTFLFGPVILILAAAGCNDTSEKHSDYTDPVAELRETFPYPDASSGAR